MLSFAVFELWDGGKTMPTEALMLSVCRVFFGGAEPLIMSSV